MFWSCNLIPCARVGHISKTAAAILCDILRIVVRHRCHINVVYADACHGFVIPFQVVSILVQLIPSVSFFSHVICHRVGINIMSHTDKKILSKFHNLRKFN